MCPLPPPLPGQQQNQIIGKVQVPNMVASTLNAGNTQQNQLNASGTQAVDIKFSGFSRQQQPVSQPGINAAHATSSHQNLSQNSQNIIDKPIEILDNDSKVAGKK